MPPAQRLTVPRSESRCRVGFVQRQLRWTGAGRWFDQAEPYVVGDQARANGGGSAVFLHGKQFEGIRSSLIQSITAAVESCGEDTSGSECWTSGREAPSVLLAYTL